MDRRSSAEKSPPQSQIQQDGGEDNLARQCEETQALAAIYGEDFTIADEASRMYEVRVKSELDSLYSLTILLLLPPDYPSRAPPVFEMHSVWMGDTEKRLAMDALYAIYRENRGEIVIYQWVEKLREFIDEKVRENKKKQTGTQTEAVDLTMDSTQEMDELEEELEEVDNYIIEEKPAVNILKPAVSHTNSIEIIHGEPFTDRKSTFQSHLAFVSNEIQVKQALQELKTNRKIAHATHNIMAYRIYKEDHDTYIQDCDDDGESAAGARLLHLLEILRVQNIVVVVSRWYGGILLGPDRFKHINNSARELIKSVGLIDNKEGSERKDAKVKSKSKYNKKK